MSNKDSLIKLVKPYTNVLGVGGLLHDLESVNIGGYITLYVTERSDFTRELADRIERLYNTDETLEPGDLNYTVVNVYPYPLETNEVDTVQMKRGVDF